MSHEIFFYDNVVKLIGGGSVINRGYPIYFILFLSSHQTKVLKIFKSSLDTSVDIKTEIYKVLIPVLLTVTVFVTSFDSNPAETMSNRIGSGWI